MSPGKEPTVFWSVCQLKMGDWSLREGAQKVEKDLPYRLPPNSIGEPGIQQERTPAEEAGFFAAICSRQ